ncbi:MAG: phosphate acyltransferase, partial [Ginsengibacter sp.]
AMKVAAVKALAQLAKLPVPDMVTMAYNEKTIVFGPTYIIPKPLDMRLLTSVAPAVAKAAMDSGVARQPITDWDKYSLELNERLGIGNHLLRMLGSKARKNPKKVVFAEAENLKVLKTAQMTQDEGICFPILLGDRTRIAEIAASGGIDISGIPIIDPKSEDAYKKRMEYGELFFAKRQRRGSNLYEAKKIMRDRNYFGCMMVETGEADAMISGLTKNYPDTIRPALQAIGMEKGSKKLAGMYIMLTKKGPLFLADTTINFNPTAEELADIAIMVAKEVRSFGITPYIALLSYSNFGSSSATEAKLVSHAREIAKQKESDLVIDGEMQANVAFNKEILKGNYPFSELVDKEVNVLIFPNLAAGNVTYNLLQEVGGFDAIGPVLLGLNKPVHILQLGSNVQSIYNMVLIAVVDAQLKCKKKNEENEL